VGRYPLDMSLHPLGMAGKIVAQFRKGDLIATAPIRQNITHQKEPWGRACKTAPKPPRLSPRPEPR